MIIRTKLSVLFLVILLTALSHAAERTNLNTATTEELIALPHVGKYTAEKIIEMRPIENLDALLSIRGMKPAELDELRELVTLEEPSEISPSPTPRAPVIPTDLQTTTTTKKLTALDVQESLPDPNPPPQTEMASAEFAKPLLKAAPGVPQRPAFPRTFPLQRPTQEGRVVAWGFGPNSRGRDDEAQELITPPENLLAVQVASTAQRSITKIYSLALKSDGTVIAWGYNGDGQCEVPSGLSDVVSVAAGDGVSMAIKADGTIAVWGQGKVSSFIPKDLRNMVQAAFTQSGLLLLSADGRCRFISERHGEDTGTVENYLQRDGTVVRRARNMTPGWEKAISAENLVAIAGGRDGYGLTAEGEIVVFSGDDGPAGMVPKDLGAVAALPIVPGYCDYVAAILIDGTVRAWGRNDSGQCDVPGGLPPIKFLSTGPNRVAAITTDGKLVNWGSNWHGEQDIPDELANVRFLQVVAGDRFTVAIVQEENQ